MPRLLWVYGTVSAFYGVKGDWDGGWYGARFDFGCEELSKVALNLQNNEKEIRDGVGGGQSLHSDTQVRVEFS